MPTIKADGPLVRRLSATGLYSPRPERCKEKESFFVFDDQAKKTGVEFATYQSALQSIADKLNESPDVKFHIKKAFINKSVWLGTASEAKEYLRELASPQHQMRKTM